MKEDGDENKETDTELHLRDHERRFLEEHYLSYVKERLDRKNKRTRYFNPKFYGYDDYARGITMMTLHENDPVGDTFATDKLTGCSMVTVQLPGNKLGVFHVNSKERSPSLRKKIKKDRNMFMGYPLKEDANVFEGYHYKVSTKDKKKTETAQFTMVKESTGWIARAFKDRSKNDYKRKKVTENDSKRIDIIPQRRK